MRFAIISDIHANLQAFEAVLADLSTQNVDSVIGLGDVVGYGTQPAEVLALARQHVDVMLMGNHDAAVADLMDTSEFSDGAVLAIESTKTVLDKSALDYLESLPLECTGPNFICAHADLVNPENYDYTESTEDALRCFEARTEQLIFVGHTHEPAVFLLNPDGGCDKFPFENYKLMDGCRYLINPGSVGMPRTNDLRATYCIYDTDLNKVLFRRVSYDVQAFRKMIAKDAKSSEQIAYVMELLDKHLLPVRKKRKPLASPRTKKRLTPRVVAVNGNSKLQPLSIRAGETTAGAKKPAPRHQGKSKAGMVALVLAAAAGLAAGLYAVNHHGTAGKTALPPAPKSSASKPPATPSAPLIKFSNLVLENRWSFNNSLEDSVDKRTAAIVDFGANDVVLGSNQVVIAGGVREVSGYVLLGRRLLAGKTNAVTLELWATQLSTRYWGRIFDFGSGPGNSLFMSWSAATNGSKDRVGWSQSTMAQSTVDDSNSPYVLGKEYHIVMIIEPGAGPKKTTQVRWHSAPSDSSMIGAARGSFATSNTLAALEDSIDSLGRSFDPSDDTANASYNEVRLWTGAPTWEVLEKLHHGGPDTVFK